ncbi:MAG: phosphatidylserine decarboxylase family protein [Candidatus Lernaella stagnicola]|nr:phosphatidylserine decarboxylase family protein [Candidatus Lernaella stagnicola]
MRRQDPYIVREGWPFIAVAALILLVFIVFHLPLWITIPWLLVFVWVVAFFRNPPRTPPVEKDAIICPADGEVVSVAEIDDERYDHGRCRRVCIFMSPFNVHVNRAPVSGKVIKKETHHGKFLIASAEKASLDNEQCALTIQMPGGRLVTVVQIAGMVARRIVTYPNVGDTVERAERFGLIRFGSRVDLYLPLEAEIDVVVGDHVKGAATCIGRLSDGEQ